MPDDSLLITRIPKRLRTQVVDRLRGVICQQRFPQGSRLVERQLCEMLGVSRTLVREARRQLEAEDFLVANPAAAPPSPAWAACRRHVINASAYALQTFVERNEDGTAHLPPMKVKL